MSPENDLDGVLSAVEEILETEKYYSLSIPFGILHDLGIGMTLIISSEGNLSRENLSRIKVRTKLEGVVQSVSKGGNEYQINGNQLVTLSMTGAELAILGNSICEIPKGNYINDSNSEGFSGVAQKLDAYRRSCLSSFVILEKRFVDAGGRIDQDLRKKVAAELS